MAPDCSIFLIIASLRIKIRIKTFNLKVKEVHSVNKDMIQTSKSKLN